MTSRKIQPAEFLKLAGTLPVIDVRSPKEFSQGHIPGAFSIPLFSDEERAQVGITYTKSGNRLATMKGLEIVGPKLKDYAVQAQKIAPGGEVLVHCWRGGMRSEAMAWLFSFSGFKTSVLEGGYRAYRRYIRDALSIGPSMIVLGGMTGSGKTEILRHLSEQGEQVVDLENLAHHKGSAFGSLGEPEQPTTEQFENDLAKVWMALDPGKPAWIEDESLNIGKVIIPDVFFQRMRNSPMYYIDLSFENRVERLLKEYGSFDREILTEIIIKISKRMGGDITKYATDSLLRNDKKKAVETVLSYYDKTYKYSLKSRGEVKINLISGDDFASHHAIATHLKTIRSHSI